MSIRPLIACIVLVMALAAASTVLAGRDDKKQTESCCFKTLDGVFCLPCAVTDIISPCLAKGADQQTPSLRDLR